MTDPHIAELNESIRRSEAKIAALIERHPALRNGVEREHLERLKARHRELAVKVLMLRKNMKKKPEFVFLPAGQHLLRPLEGELVLVAVDEHSAITIEPRGREI